MPIKQQLDTDLKAALLGGDKPRVEVLRGLKSAILYAEVAAGNRETGGLDDTAVQGILAKESKKRQESADLYIQGGSQDKADKELSEKVIIDAYLPAQLSEDELSKIIDEAIASTGATSPAQMGQVIGAVKSKAGASADGSLIAKLVKERLN